jgi:L-methionine (R)-S-oxide reductase
MDRNYDDAIARVRAIGDRDDRMAALVDTLWDVLAPAGVSWVGFYIDGPGEPDDRRLVLGPCRDKPACSPIGLHGACGQALLAGETLVVRDVADLGPGYIACDPRDRSEIVVPLLDAEGRAWGVLDLDSFDVGAFDETDAAGLDRVLQAAGLAR